MKTIAAIIAAFTPPHPHPSYQERQASAHAEYNAWYTENAALAEQLGLDSWHEERARIARVQKSIDANNKSARSVYCWCGGTWKRVGFKNESCIIRK